MRWSQGVWSEKSLIQAVNNTSEFFAIPYGPSGTAPDDIFRSVKIYFERLEAAGLGENKRPDLLVFKKSSQGAVDALVRSLGGIGKLPFTPENSSQIQELLAEAILAIECENSLWRGKRMPDYYSNETSRDDRTTKTRSPPGPRFRVSRFRARDACAGDGSPSGKAPAITHRRRDAFASVTRRRAADAQTPRAGYV